MLRDKGYIVCYFIVCYFIVCYLQLLTMLFLIAAIGTDVLCYILIPVQWLFFAASSYVWVQYVWHTGKSPSLLYHQLVNVSTCVSVPYDVIQYRTYLNMYSLVITVG